MLNGVFTHAVVAKRPEDHAPIKVRIDVGERLIPVLATFGVDAGIIDAPGHVVGTIMRDKDGKITGLELEPV